jgi:hypothetical protein
VGADLFLQRPAETQESSVDPLRLGCAPDAHAAKSALSGAGTSSPLSIMSANT